MLAVLGTAVRRRELAPPTARLAALAACHCATHLADVHKHDTRAFSANHGVVELSDQGARLEQRGGDPTPRSSRPASLLASLTRQARATMLPANYPDSVRPGYLAFVGWQAVQHAAGSANGVLASTCLLHALGVGDGAAAAAGALNWVLKDGLGQAGTLLFARLLAADLDVHARWWYLAAAAQLNLATALEISTVLCPTAFLPIAALANALKGLAWMAGGSARALFVASFAGAANVADLTAKATSQTICTSLLGTAAGIGVATAAGQAFWPTAAASALLATVHMASGAAAARRVPLATLSPGRVAALIAAFLDDEQASSPTRLPTPAELAPQEALAPGPGDVVGVGVPRRELLRMAPPVAAALVRESAGRRYALLPGPRCTVLLHELAGADDALLAALHVCLARKAGVEDDALAMAALSVRARLLFPELRAALVAAGWDVAALKLESVRQRAVW